MIVVSWGDGHVAAVSDTGEVIDASSRAARREVEDRIANPVIRQFVHRGQEYEETIEPNRPGHVRAALEALDGATLT
jgi:hypothetical protein